MDIQNKTKDELIQELQELKQQHDALKVAYEADILERKRAEERLRDREEHFRTTLYSIGDGVISTDKNGRVVDMNPVAESLCGLTLADALEKPLKDIFRIVH